MLSKARFHSLLKFSRKKERTAAGMFFVEGWRWLEEALDLAQPPECVLAVAEAPRSAAEAGLLARARATAKEFHEIPPEKMARLTDNVRPPGVAALVRWQPGRVDDLDATLPRNGPALVIALDGVSDPGNAGTIVRTADWFGAAGIVFGSGSVEPINPKTVRATMGSLFRLPIAIAEGLSPTLKRLRLAGFSAVGATLDGEDLRAFPWPERCVLVIGNEANGIRSSLAASLDRRVRIPSYGRAESLNAAVAAALLTADWRQRHPPPG
ncbi:MAG: TrmH family RNA methyltransferase [Opitutaceae bacterium]